MQLLKFELAIYESTFFRVLSDALAKGDYALAKRIVNSAIDVPAGGSRTYAFDLYSKLVEAFPMLGVGAMSETVWDKLVKKLQQMIGEVERRTQQKETENLAGAGDGR